MLRGLTQINILTYSQLFVFVALDYQQKKP